MSVQTNQYLIAGLRLPYDNDTYELYEDYLDSAYEGIKEKDGVSVIYDGMNGEYILVGKILMKSEVYEPLDGPIELSEPDMLMKYEIAEKSHRLFGTNQEASDVKLWLVTNYR